MPKAGGEDSIRDALRALEAAKAPLDALDAARRLREAGEALERDAVQAARREGVSWSKIGSLYGLTKQGAQQRFKAQTEAGRRVSERGESPSGSPS